MTLTAMSDEQLSRIIAEHLEPLASFAAWYKETPESCSGYDRLGNVEYLSPRRAWSYTERNYQEWKPRDFINNPRDEHDAAGEGI